MVGNRKLSVQAVWILSAFVNGPDDEYCGADLMRLTKLPSGTIYPLLIRFEEANYLSSRWETDEPKSLGRPRRRIYRITSSGHKAFQSAAAEYETVRSLGWI